MKISYKTARLMMELTQIELANELQISQGTIAKIESGSNHGKWKDKKQNIAMLFEKWKSEEIERINARVIELNNMELVS